MSKSLPIGYLKCIECDKPALWLIDDVEYKPNEKNIGLVDMVVKYKLINLNMTNYNPEEEDSYLCDSCGCKIIDSNLESKYLMFITNLESRYIQ